MSSKTNNSTWGLTETSFIIFLILLAGFLPLSMSEDMSETILAANLLFSIFSFISNPLSKIDFIISNLIIVGKTQSSKLDRGYIF